MIILSLIFAAMAALAIRQRRRKGSSASSLAFALIGISGAVITVAYDELRDDDFQNQMQSHISENQGRDARFATEKLTRHTSATKDILFLFSAKESPERIAELQKSFSSLAGRHRSSSTLPINIENQINFKDFAEALRGRKDTLVISFCGLPSSSETACAAFLENPVEGLAIFVADSPRVSIDPAAFESGLLLGWCVNDASGRRICISQDNLEISRQELPLFFFQPDPEMQAPR